MMGKESSDRFLVYSAILCVTVAVCYYRAKDCGFVFDDQSAIVKNKDLKPTTPIIDVFLNDFWGTPMHEERSHKSYRPLCVLTFRLNYWWNELETTSYHVFNVVLHAIVCIVFMRVCSMFLSETPSFVAAMLYAVHPVHTEAVTGVVGRAESLSSIFFLAALITYSKCTGYHSKTVWMPLYTTIALVSIAMLCKEQGITVIGVCVVYELFVAQRATFRELWDILMDILRGRPNLPPWLQDSIIRSLVLVGSTTFLLIARIKVMGAQLPVFTNFDNPASVSPIPGRQLTFNYLLPVNMWLLIFPANLCCDWTMGTIPILKSITDPRNVFTVIFYVGFGKMVHFSLQKQGRLNRAVIMSLALMVLPFIPASNLFFPVGFVVAERILYTPSMGFTMLVAAGFEYLLENRKSLKYLLWALMAELMLFHAVKTCVRNEDWLSEHSLFMAALKVNTRNAKCWNNVGHALENEEKFSLALEYFKKAASVQPDDIGAHMNVGRTYKHLQMYEEAEKAYTKAKDLFPPVVPGKTYTARVAPSHLNAYLMLASIASRDPNRLHEADELLQTVTQMRPDYVEGYINRGDIMMKLGRPMDAIACYEKALRYRPKNADCHFNLGVVHAELGKKDVAYKYYEQALIHEPDHWQALYNSASLIQELKITDQYQVAANRLDTVIQKDSNHSFAPFTLALIAMDVRDLVAAEKYFKLAIKNDPTFRSAHFNLALMLHNDLKRSAEALPLLENVLKLYPDYVKAHMLLGEVTVNTVKDLKKAEESFRKVIELEPNNVEAIHNLCVVYVEAGDLFTAEKCLQNAHKLAPKEVYIVNNLRTVQAKIQEGLRKKAAAEKQAESKPGNEESKQQTDEGKKQQAESKLGNEESKQENSGDNTQQASNGNP